MADAFFAKGRFGVLFAPASDKKGRAARSMRETRPSAFMDEGIFGDGATPESQEIYDSIQRER